MIASPGLFHRTCAFCCACGEMHGASYHEDEQGRVRFDLECPRGTRHSLVSSDAALFRAIRGRGCFPAPILASARGFSWVNFLDITQECNLSCPVCYASAGPGQGRFASLEQVLGIARQLREQGLRAITLTGGEPTLHPELIPMIRHLRRMGMEVTLPSNGLLLAEDPALAPALKGAGLHFLHLQFDTLCGETSRQLRGADYVDLKQRALANLKRSRLRHGLMATVVQENLTELGDLLRLAVRQGPPLGVVVFQAAAPAGRFLLGQESLVSREDLIGSILASGAVEGLEPRHFRPFPRFAPMALDLHPDCGGLLLLAVDQGRLRPLDAYLDLDRIYAWMGSVEGPRSPSKAMLLLTRYVSRGLRSGQRSAYLSSFLGTFLKRGPKSILIVSLEQFLGECHQDQERLDRCTTHYVLPNGIRVPNCIFRHPDPRRLEAYLSGRDKAT